jgi:queuine tRNA-ribosyltransferase
MDQMEKTSCSYGYNQALFPIIQGSTYKDLRQESAKVISSFNAFGNAIGGLSVGEPEEDLYEMTALVTEILPKEKPRYLMGVGTPWNLLECIALGVDMFDCVMPSRNARHGLLFTSNGTINIKNKKWSTDFSAIDEHSDCYVDLNYSKAYLRHLLKSGEFLGMQIATIHNLAFYLRLMKEARARIIDGSFTSWKNTMVKQMNKRL